jgi:hypothetical protein
MSLAQQCRACDESNSVCDNVGALRKAMEVEWLRMPPEKREDSFTQTQRVMHPLSLTDCHAP